MFFIGGVSHQEKELGKYNNLICPVCGAYTMLHLFMSCSVLHFFFIPLFRFGRQYYGVSQCCGSSFALAPDKGRALEKGELVELSPDDFQVLHRGQALRRCQTCGREADPSFAYCPYCGKPL
ncbi:MAG: zinc ribbon domain-containing protein [Eubacteriales bacterium]